MPTKRAAIILLLSGALALAAEPALAQHGGHGGGGHPGGGGAGRAVPRGGGGGGYHPGGGAQARHPRAGTGSYYHGYHGGYYGGHYGHYPYYGYGYGHGHYPYYGYGYYPYYGSSFSFGLSFGWPYYYGGWYPYASYGYYPGYYPPPANGYGYDAPQGPQGGGEGGSPPYGSGRACSALRANGGDTGRVRLEVRPEDASVYVDNEFCGNAQEARFLSLAPGRHSIELVRPGFEVARRETDVVTGRTVDVLVELQQRTY